MLMESTRETAEMAASLTLLTIMESTVPIKEVKSCSQIRGTIRRKAAGCCRDVLRRKGRFLFDSLQCTFISYTLSAVCFSFSLLYRRETYGVIVTEREEECKNVSLCCFRQEGGEMRPVQRIAGTVSL